MSVLNRLLNSLRLFSTIYFFLYIFLYGQILILVNLYNISYSNSYFRIINIVTDIFYDWALWKVDVTVGYAAFFTNILFSTFLVGIPISIISWLKYVIFNEKQFFSFPIRLIINWLIKNR